MMHFFFQAEDGIRAKLVTGVQTCALPISGRAGVRAPQEGRRREGHQPRPPGHLATEHPHLLRGGGEGDRLRARQEPAVGGQNRSEEHTSELQSLAYLVCRLLLEKKKIKKK